MWGREGRKEGSEEGRRYGEAALGSENTLTGDTTHDVKHFTDEEQHIGTAEGGKAP